MIGILLFMSIAVGCRLSDAHKFRESVQDCGQHHFAIPASRLGVRGCRRRRDRGSMSASALRFPDDADEFALVAGNCIDTSIGFHKLSESKIILDIIRDEYATRP